MRPILAPGTHVLRRSARELQVGLDSRRAAVLPDRPEVRAVLDRLRAAAPVEEDDPVATALVAALAERGLTVDSAAMAGPAEERHTVAALARTDGLRAADLLLARRRARLRVSAFGPPYGQVLADRLAGLLEAAGLGVEHDRGPATTLDLLVGVGEPRRDLLDRRMRAGVPHLLVRSVEGVVTLGPYVVPGRTACLRCLDAHHTAADPAWPLLVEQHAAAAARERPDGAAEPVDDLVMGVALAWAARDAATAAEGGRPSTWSTTLTFGDRLGALETQAWLRHPGCGCAWQ